MLFQIVLNNFIRYILCVAPTLVIIGVTFCKLLHTFLKGFYLTLYVCRSIGVFNICEDWFPLVHHCIVLEPQIVDTYQVTLMVQHKIQECLLHLISVALTDGVVCHERNRSNWVISLAAASLGMFDRTATKRAVLACQIAIHFIAGCLIPTLKWNVILKHLLYLLIAFLAQQTTVVYLCKCCRRSIVHKLPQFRSVMVLFIGINHLLCRQLCHSYIIVTCQSGKTGIVAFTEIIKCFRTIRIFLLVCVKVTLCHYHITLQSVLCHHVVSQFQTLIIVRTDYITDGFQQWLHVAHIVFVLLCSIDTAHSVLCQISVLKAVNIFHSCSFA